MLTEKIQAVQIVLVTSLSFMDPWGMTDTHPSRPLSTTPVHTHLHIHAHRLIYIIFLINRITLFIRLQIASFFKLSNLFWCLSMSVYRSFCFFFQPFKWHSKYPTAWMHHTLFSHSLTGDTQTLKLFTVNTAVSIWVPVVFRHICKYFLGCFSSGKFVCDEGKSVRW